jgi:hypothetical protein
MIARDEFGAVITLPEPLTSAPPSSLSQIKVGIAILFRYRGNGR